ncbi:MULTISPECIES: DUF3883 domain-containing protein [unclassified Caballeronia]|uniref:DUF3883 domain-containing protein n=1 Tax=unclassified Caballeronia TaxID=2646786 RepID=UPI0028559DA7|nr:MULTISPECIES: DUF3883 domain-containing protein [unclassified Caballeronia]MDR5750212.1 DUF3883 domain-containing protein [Caballeronia sp. LZ024]MDR5842659.1 DUF3883 domain-containing protein [Caballeronia sp. LZ031]
MTFKKLQTPTAVDAAIQEFDSVGRTAFLEKYGFGKSREYMLRDPGTGKLYDSKAIVGAAHGYAFPDEGPLRAADFSGGEATVERVLLDLGFEVVRVGQDWTTDEVAETVESYFEMLQLESLGIAYNKSERNEQLRIKLPARSKASIELKYQNISAVLSQLALPYIQGYKPRANFQSLLRQTVMQYVDTHRTALMEVMEHFDERTTPGEQQFRGVLVEPPKIETLPSPAQRMRLPKKLDYAAREERNRTLGRGGEAWTMGFEETRLIDAARPDLASKIDWISDRLGDGTGYDILSFETSEIARFVEVKTTNGASATPFIVTRNELEFSEETEDAFCLYRVFDFAVAPKLFVLRGPLGANLDLEPLDFRARLKATT